MPAFQLEILLRHELLLHQRVNASRAAVADQQRSHAPNGLHAQRYLPGGGHQPSFLIQRGGTAETCKADTAKICKGLHHVHGGSFAAGAGLRDHQGIIRAGVAGQHPAVFLPFLHIHIRAEQVDRSRDFFINLQHPADGRAAVITGARLLEAVFAQHHVRVDR